MAEYSWDVPLKNGERLVVTGSEMGTDAVLQVLECGGILPEGWIDDSRMTFSPRKEG